jgi:hypothetical protein
VHIFDPDEPDERPEIDVSNTKRAWKRDISRMTDSEILLVSGAPALLAPQQGGGVACAGGGGVQENPPALPERDEDEDDDEDEDKDPLEHVNVPVEAVKHLEDHVVSIVLKPLGASGEF